MRAVRGTDSLVISKLQRDGWKLVEQAQGKLRSTLSFRRPKTRLDAASARLDTKAATLLRFVSAVSIFLAT